MNGILLFAVIGLWLWVCTAITRALMRRLPTWWHSGIGLLVWIALLVLPVGDEIVGGFQFRALCERNAVFHVGVGNPNGRTTRYSSSPLNEAVPGTAIPIYHTGDVYTDVQSGEIVVRSDLFVAEGGVFIRALGIAERNAPITIGRPYCSPEDVRGERVHRTLKFSVIN